MKKYTKIVKYFKTWHIKPKNQSRMHTNSLKNDIHSHKNMRKTCKTFKNYVYSPDFYNKDIRNFKDIIQNL